MMAEPPEPASLSTDEAEDQEWQGHPQSVRLLNTPSIPIELPDLPAVNPQPHSSESLAQAHLPPPAADVGINHLRNCTLCFHGDPMETPGHVMTPSIP